MTRTKPQMMVITYVSEDAGCFWSGISGQLALIGSSLLCFFLTLLQIKNLILSYVGWWRSMKMEPGRPEQCCFTKHADSWVLLPETLTQHQKFPEFPLLTSVQVMLIGQVRGAHCRPHWPRPLISRKLR